MQEILKYCSPGERRRLKCGHIFSGLTGLVIPSFIFLLGPIFDAFGETDKDKQRDQILMLNAVMFGLAIFVWIGSW